MKEQLNRKHIGTLQPATNAEAMRTIIATVLAVLIALGLISLNTTPYTATNLHIEQQVVVDVPIVEVPQNTPVELASTVQEPSKPTTCAEEVLKYSAWNQEVAHAVMMAESANRADNHNDDASTGDYSIGCFQINLLGPDNLLAKYRDAVATGYVGQKTVAELEVWLKDARNNVAVAHRMYERSGWQPWQATTCRFKVKCY